VARRGEKGNGRQIARRRCRHILLALAPHPLSPPHTHIPTPPRSFPGLRWQDQYMIVSEMIAVRVSARVKRACTLSRWGEEPIPLTPRSLCVPPLPPPPSHFSPRTRWPASPMAVLHPGSRKTSCRRPRSGWSLRCVGIPCAAEGGLGGERPPSPVTLTLNLTLTPSPNPNSAAQQGQGVERAAAGGDVGRRGGRRNGGGEGMMRVREMWTHTFYALERDISPSARHPAPSPSPRARGNLIPSVSVRGASSAPPASRSVSPRHKTPKSY
jgi:hypothetical protein